MRNDLLQKEVVTVSYCLPVLREEQRDLLDPVIVVTNERVVTDAFRGIHLSFTGEKRPLQYAITSS